MDERTEAAPLVSALNAVYLYAKDMPRTTAFYRDVLAIPLRGDDHWAEATLGAVRFALHEWHEGAPEPAASGINVNFEVGDIDTAVEHLRAHGVETGEIHREPFGSFATFRDPEGYVLELFEPPRARS